MPTESANAQTLFEIANTFGLGVAVLGGWIFFLLKDIKDYKEKERLHSKELLELSKENIATMHSLTQVVEAIAPAITASSNEAKRELEASVNKIKEHINTQCSLMEKILRKEAS
jgi:uncharacterized membrane protein YraQ (UPF0718 family)